MSQDVTKKQWAKDVTYVSARDTRAMVGVTDDTDRTVLEEVLTSACTVRVGRSSPCKGRGGGFDE